MTNATSNVPTDDSPITVQYSSRDIHKITTSSFGMVNLILLLTISYMYVVYDHYNDVIMSTMASQITSLTIVYSTVYSVADQRKDSSSASLACVKGIRRWPVNYPHKGPVARKIPFDDVIMPSEFLKEDGTCTTFKIISCVYKT